MPKQSITREGKGIRYLQDAREILEGLVIEDHIYLDVNTVKRAFGIAYLAVLDAIKEELLKKGVTRKDMPKSVEGYMVAIQKYLSVNNGRLVREFDRLYDSLHIAGHYRGLLTHVGTVREEMDAAERFIKKITGSQ
ncbi:MAG: DUF5618 family protein [Nitrospirae bacterium]|nr:DUF5618 family protein [Nitrospirota bacterium]MBF0593137.1 DUF5618 family protein [Nitrospirota bacterium]